MPTQHRILITGASGFVGTWLLKVLGDFPVDTGLELVSAGRGPGYDVSFDLANKAAVKAAVRDVRPTAVVHLAAMAAPREANQDPDQAWNVNFRGTLNLAAAVLDEAPDSRFVFAGSSEAYGQSFAVASKGVVNEDTPLRPATVYGATKAAADIAVGQMVFDGLRCIRFRPFNHTGPGQTDTYVIPAFASQIARIEAGLAPPIVEVGNLSARRDFLDVRDVARAYALIALGGGQDLDGSVFNLASGKPVSIRSILETLLRLSGHDIEIAVAQDRLRPVDIPVACGDASAARDHLGWTPQFQLEETLAAVLSDWRDRVHANE